MASADRREWVSFYSAMYPGIGSMHNALIMCYTIKYEDEKTKVNRDLDILTITFFPERNYIKLKQDYVSERARGGFSFIRWT